jgi:O-antigen/teichoic acid export membrane protein
MIQRAGAVLRTFLSFKAHDVSTAAGRSAERLRRITLTALASGGSRVIGLLAPLITIPVTLRYLGDEQYGLWMTITTVVSLFAYADLGLGNGLLTAVSQASGREDSAEMRRCISSGFFLLLSVGGSLLVVLLLGFGRLPWDSILGIQDSAYHRTAAAAVLVSIVLVLVNLPISLVQRVQLGLQQGFQSSMWQTGGSLAGMAALLLAVKFRASLPMLVLCATGAPCVALLLNFLWFFAIEARQFLPRPRSVSWEASKQLLGQGIQYFILSLLLLICFGIDNLILAHVLGHTAVTEFSIPFRLVSVLGFLPSIVLMPFWTANGEAIARGELDWVRRSLRHITRLMLVVMMLAGSFVLLGGPLVLTRCFGLHAPQTMLMAALIGGALANAIAGPHFMVLNGAGAVGVQLLIYGVLAPVYVVGKVLLAMRFGVPGPAIAGAVIGLVCLYPLARAASLREIQKQGLKIAQARGDLTVASALPG